MHDRVRAPRAPLRGDFPGPRRSAHAQGAHQNQIGRWKRIWPAKGTHCDVLGGPVSDARNRPQRGDLLSDLGAWFESYPAFAERTRKPVNRSGSLRHDPQTRQVRLPGLRNRLRQREYKLKPLDAGLNRSAETTSNPPC